MDEIRLKEILSGFSSIRIAVVGDLFLDKWLYVDRRLDEPSLETGLTAYQVVRARSQPGAAGTILANLSALKVGKLYAVGFVGDDGEGYDLLKGLDHIGVDRNLVLKSREVMTPAYVKPMFFRTGGGREHNRFDHKNMGETPREMEQAVIENIRQVAPMVDAVIVLDQLTCENTGVVTRAVRQAIAQIALNHPELIVFADSRAFINQFRHIILKCNNKEAAKLAGAAQEEPFDQEKLCDYMEQLAQSTHSQVFVTCGEHGVLVRENGECHLLPAVRYKGEIDVCGAGDACSSGIVTSLCAGASYVEAAQVGNLVSGVTVRKIGTTGTATHQEIMDIFHESAGKT